MVGRPSIAAIAALGIVTIHAGILLTSTSVVEDWHKKQTHLNSKYLRYWQESTEQPAADEANNTTQDDAKSSSTTILDMEQYEGSKQRRLESSCMGWHVDMSNQNGCTDDSNYPAQWVEDDELRRLMFHPTKEACCNRMFPIADCKIYETGCFVAPPPAPVSAPLLPIIPQQPTIVSYSSFSSNGVNKSPGLDPVSPPFATIDSTENENCISPGWHPVRIDIVC